MEKDLYEVILFKMEVNIRYRYLARLLYNALNEALWKQTLITFDRAYIRNLLRIAKRILEEGY